MSNILINGTFSPNGPFPITVDTDGYGGFRVVPDLATRNAIIDADRKEGMWVQVIEDKVYLLNAPPWNHTDSDWTAVVVGMKLPVDGNIDFTKQLAHSIFIDQSTIQGTSGGTLTVQGGEGANGSFTPPTSNYTTVVLANTPLIYWRLNDNVGSTSVVDSSGNGRGGNVTGTTTFGNAGLIYDGDTSVIVASGGQIKSALNVGGTNTHLSVEFFLLADLSGQASVHDSTGLWVITINTDGSVTFGIFSSGSLPAGTIVNGVAYHFVLVYDHFAGQSTLYINGVPVGVATGSVFSLWRQATITGPGTFSEFSLYRSIALTGAQVLAHFQAGIGTLINPGNGGDIIVSAGAAGAPDGYNAFPESANGGNVFIRGGAGSNGVAGQINVGDSYTSAINIGAVGVSTIISGVLQSASTPDLIFAAGIDHQLKIADTISSGTGNGGTFTIAAGTGGGGQLGIGNGGQIDLNTGNGQAGTVSGAGGVGGNMTITLGSPGADNGAGARRGWKLYS